MLTIAITARHADDDAEHRQHRAHLVAHQRSKGHANDHCQVHNFSMHDYPQIAQITQIK